MVLILFKFIAKFINKNSLGFVIGVILITNLASLLLVYKTRVKNDSPFTLLTFSLNLSDILFSLSPIILLVHDFIDKGTFVVKEITWRGSVSCFLTLGIILFFSVLSPTFITFMSLSRLMVVLHPLHSKFKNINFIKKLFFLLSLFLSIFAYIFVNLQIN